MASTNETHPGAAVGDIALQPQSAGQRLRNWRTARGLTLKDVAQETGIPVPALSKLENGKQSLGYPRLLKLSALLGVELGQLLSTEGPPVNAVQPLGRRSINRHGEDHTFDDEELADRYLATDLRHKAMTPIVCDVTVKAGGEPESWSRHPGEEFVLVLSGELEFHSEIYAPVLLSPGDSIYFDAAVGHNYFSADGDMCRFLSVVQSPAVGTESRRASSFHSRARQVKSAKGSKAASLRSRKGRAG